MKNLKVIFYKGFYICLICSFGLFVSGFFHEACSNCAWYRGNCFYLYPSEAYFYPVCCKDINCVQDYYDTIDSWPYPDNYEWPYPDTPCFSLPAQQNSSKNSAYSICGSTNPWPEAYITHSFIHPFILRIYNVWGSQGPFYRPYYHELPVVFYKAEAGIPREGDMDGLSLAEITETLQDLTGHVLMDNWVNPEVENYLTAQNIKLQGGSLLFHENITDYIMDQVSDLVAIPQGKFLPIVGNYGTRFLLRVAASLGCGIEITDYPDIETKVALFRSTNIDLEKVINNPLNNDTNAHESEIYLRLGLKGWAGVYLGKTSIKFGCDNVFGISSHITANVNARCVVPFDVDVRLGYKLYYSCSGNSLEIRGEPKLLIVNADGKDFIIEEDPIVEINTWLSGVDWGEKKLHIDDKINKELNPNYS